MYPEQPQVTGWSSVPTWPPSDHTFPCWAGSLLGLLPGPAPQGLGSIHHRLEASCPERDSPGGSKALSRAGKAAEGPLSYILTAPSRQRAHFI